MKIYYGIISNLIDVTDICLSKLLNNNIISIPSGDINRANYFTDPIIGTLKKIFILNDNNLTEYEHFHSITPFLISNADYLPLQNLINGRCLYLSISLKLNPHLQ